MIVTTAVILNSEHVLDTMMDNIVLGLMEIRAAAEAGVVGGEEAADVPQHVQPARRGRLGDWLGIRWTSHHGWTHRFRGRSSQILMGGGG